MVTSQSQELGDEQRVAGDMNCDESHERFHEVHQVRELCADRYTLGPFGEEEDKVPDTCNRRGRGPESQVGLASRGGLKPCSAVASLWLHEPGRSFLSDESRLIQGRDGVLHDTDYEVGKLRVGIHHPGVHCNQRESGSDGTNRKEGRYNPDFLVAFFLDLRRF